MKEILDYKSDSVDLFSESPLKVKKWNVDVLEPLGKNHLFTISVKEKGKLIGKFDTKYEIYQYITGEYIIDCFIDGDFTVAFIQYTIDKNNNWCDLYKIWQDTLHLGLIRKIILEYYLKKYSGILTGDIHTELGEKSVKKLLQQAKEIGHKIYVVKDNTEKIPIEDESQLSHYYSFGLGGMKYKFLIEK